MAMCFLSLVGLVGSCGLSRTRELSHKDQLLQEAIDSLHREVDSPPKLKTQEDAQRSFTSKGILDSSIAYEVIRKFPKTK